MAMQVTMLYSENEWQLLETLIRGTRNKDINGWMLSKINRLCESIKLSQAEEANATITMNKVRHNVTIHPAHEEQLSFLAKQLNVTNSRLIARLITDPILFDYYKKNGILLPPSTQIITLSK